MNTAVEGLDPFNPNDVQRRWSILILGTPEPSARQLIESTLLQNQGSIYGGEYGVLPLDRVGNLNHPFNIPINSNNNQPGYYFFNLPYALGESFIYLPIESTSEDVEPSLIQFLMQHKKSSTTSNLVPVVATGIGIMALARFF